MRGRFRVVRGCLCQQMFAQRLSNRDQQRFAGLTCFDSNFIPVQVWTPSEASQIAETLPGVETEFDQALPFGIGNREDRSKLVSVKGLRVSGSRFLTVLTPLAGSCHRYPSNRAERKTILMIFR